MACLCLEEQPGQYIFAFFIFSYLMALCRLFLLGRTIDALAELTAGTAYYAVLCITRPTIPDMYIHYYCVILRTY